MKESLKKLKLMPDESILKQKEGSLYLSELIHNKITFKIPELESCFKQFKQKIRLEQYVMKEEIKPITIPLDPVKKKPLTPLETPKSEIEGVVFNNPILAINYNQKNDFNRLSKLTSKN